MQRGVATCSVLSCVCQTFANFAECCSGTAAHFSQVAAALRTRDPFAVVTQSSCRAKLSFGLVFCFSRTRWNPTGPPGPPGVLVPGRATAAPRTRRASAWTTRRAARAATSAIKFATCRWSMQYLLFLIGSFNALNATLIVIIMHARIGII